MGIIPASVKKYLAPAAYVLLVLPLIGMNISQTVLISVLTVGGLVGILGLADHFKLV